MTIHSENGLEFENVFIVGMEEELFPAQQSAYSPSALEEERRLFYVALTRAREKLILTSLPDKVEMYQKFGFKDHGIGGSVWGGEAWHEMSVELRG